MNRKMRKILASQANNESVVFGGNAIFAEATEPGKKPSFRMNAYTGGKMQPGGWAYPLVIDLSGVQAVSKSRPILRDHDTSRIVGHSTSVRVEAGQLVAEGIISGAGNDAREVSEAAASGFPWQCSVGAAVKRVVFHDEGKTVTVNGQAFDGPVYVVRKCVIGEISFVALGADDATSATVAAKSALGKENQMNEFQKWLEASFAMKEEDLEEGQLAKFKAQFEASKKSDKGLATPSGSDKPEDIEVVITASERLESETKFMRDEAVRIDTIRAACKDTPEIAAQAIKEGWTAERAELHTLKAAAQRTKADSGVRSPAIIIGSNETSLDILAAAVCLHGKLPKIEKAFNEQTLEAANKQFRSGIGLQQLLLACAWKNGYTGHSMRGNEEAVIRAAFSTADITGLLSSVSNKYMLTGFEGIESAWRLLAAIRNVIDFKTVTSYRLTGAMQYDKVAPGGELTHATAGEESFTNKADTYGKMFAITRQDIRNDDLGALTTVPQKIGRGGALKLNDVFWTAFMDNAAFFTTGNKNYDEGADTALSIAGLTLAETLFFDQTDSDGKPLGINPALLLVPNALNATAAQLMASLELRELGTSAKSYGVTNPHAGKFAVVRSSYLGNSGYTGNSAKAWYLLADPKDLAAIEVCFLDGKEVPTVETAEADFNTLGIQMRGYHDFGVAKQEPKAAVKMLGEAAGS